MFDHNSIMALKELVAGQEEDQIVENPYKGSMLNPGSIGESEEKKEVAKPNAKIEAKIGEKYVPKNKQKEEVMEEESKKKMDPKHQIWTEEEVAQLPISKQDPRPQPNFDSMYVQKVGTEDVFLGMSGVDPSSNHCHEIVYKIELPDVVAKDIQLDLNDKQMVLQTKNYYLCQYFQYKMDTKKARAKFVSDKGMLELYLPILRDNDF